MQHSTRVVPPVGGPAGFEFPSPDRPTDRPDVTSRSGTKRVGAGASLLVAVMGITVAGCATPRDETRSPMGMQHEMGRYRTPDVVLNGVDAPPPKTLHACGERWVLYAVNLQPADCGTLCPIPPLQCAPCSVAFDRAVDYFQNQLVCGHTNCRRKVGEIVWMGWSCHKDTAPPLETFTCAMEVEVWCEPEL